MVYPRRLHPQCENRQNTLSIGGQAIKPLITKNPGTVDLLLIPLEIHKQPSTICCTMSEPCARCLLYSFSSHASGQGDNALLPFILIDLFILTHFCQRQQSLVQKRTPYPLPLRPGAAPRRS